MFQKIRSFAGIALILYVFVFLIPGPALGAQTISIVGEVNDDFQITTDNNQVYEIVTDHTGEELMGHAGETVKLTGEIVEEEGDQSIKVLSYEVLE